MLIALGECKEVKNLKTKTRQLNMLNFLTSILIHMKLLIQRPIKFMNYQAGQVMSYRKEILLLQLQVIQLVQENMLRH